MRCKTCNVITKHRRVDCLGNVYSCEVCHTERNGPAPKTFRWTLEITVDDCWVADGFDFDEDRCQSIADNLCPFAYAGEVKVLVVKAPDPDAIKLAQGYPIA